MGNKLQGALAAMGYDLPSGRYSFISYDVKNGDVTEVDGVAFQLNAHTLRIKDSQGYTITVEKNIANELPF